MVKNDPIPAFRFILRVEGLWDLPVKSVGSFQKNNEYEHIQEGGLNDYVHMRRKPISQPFTFTVERYITNTWVDPLLNGSELTLPILLIVYQDDDTVGHTFAFTAPKVQGVSYGEINAEKSGLMTQTVTIAYNMLYVIPNYVDLIS